MIIVLFTVKFNHFSLETWFKIACYWWLYLYVFCQIISCEKNNKNYWIDFSISGLDWQFAMECYVKLREKQQNNWIKSTFQNGHFFVLLSIWTEFSYQTIRKIVEVFCIKKTFRFIFCQNASKLKELEKYLSVTGSIPTSFFFCRWIKILVIKYLKRKSYILYLKLISDAAFDFFLAFSTLSYWMPWFNVC